MGHVIEYCVEIEGKKAKNVLLEASGLNTSVFQNECFFLDIELNDQEVLVEGTDRVLRISTTWRCSLLLMPEETKVELLNWERRLIRLFPDQQVVRICESILEEWMSGKREEYIEKENWFTEMLLSIRGLDDEYWKKIN